MSELHLCRMQQRPRGEYYHVHCRIPLDDIALECASVPALAPAPPLAGKSGSDEDSPSRLGA